VAAIATGEPQPGQLTASHTAPTYPRASPGSVGSNQIGIDGRCIAWAVPADPMVGVR
jgi:hypothetical protein